jgi:hypothetical protein
MFTREQFEDAWQRMPYGIFTAQVKANKSKKQYRITTILEQVSATELGRHETIAWCKPGSELDLNGVHIVNQSKLRSQIKTGMRVQWRRLVENV